MPLIGQRQHGLNHRCEVHGDNAGPLWSEGTVVSQPRWQFPCGTQERG